jgi:hypothetical protein
VRDLTAVHSITCPNDGLALAHSDSGTPLLRTISSIHERNHTCAQIVYPCLCVFAGASIKIDPSIYQYASIEKLDNGLMNRFGLNLVWENFTKNCRAIYLNVHSDWIILTPFYARSQTFFDLIFLYREIQCL